MIRGFIALFLLAGFGCTAAAQEARRLKELVTVTSDIVRVGDLVDNAGSAAGAAVFRAPDLGHTGAVPVQRVVEALKARDIADLDTGGLSEVVVTRLSRVITAKDVEERIVRALAGQKGYGDTRNLGLAFDRDIRPVHIEASATGDLTIARINVEPRSGKFDVVLELPDGAAARRSPLRIAGTVTETIETATVTRTIARGDVIRESDVSIERRPKSEATGEPISADDAVGLSAKRPLKAGQVLRASDLMKADVVARNEQVIIVYEVPGIVLTVRGKALEAGAVGDTVSVLNVQSNRTIQATVTAPGQVVVTAASSRFSIASVPDNKRRRAQ